MLGYDVVIAAVTGLIGSVVTGYTNYKTQKLKNEHEQKMVELETSAMIAEAEANIKITQAQVEGEIELEDAKAYVESQKQVGSKLFDAKWIDKLWSGNKFHRFLATCAAMFFAFIDMWKASIRPFITTYLVVLSTIVTYMAWNVLQKYGLEMSSNEAVSLFNEMVLMVKYLTVSCVTWWFADRRLAKFLMRMDK